MAVRLIKDYGFHERYNDVWEGKSFGLMYRHHTDTLTRCRRAYGRIGSIPGFQEASQIVSVRIDIILYIIHKRLDMEHFPDPGIIRVILFDTPQKAFRHIGQ